MTALVEDKVKLRVYHRTHSDIVLLWSSDTLTKDQKNNVKILCEGKPLEFATSEHLGAKDSDIAKNTMVCVIKHNQINGLRPDARYNLQVILGGEESEPLVRKITVLEYGVLPAFEKDRKSARSHLMAWDPTANAWVKLPVVRTAKGYAVPVVLVQPDAK